MSGGQEGGDDDVALGVEGLEEVPWGGGGGGHFWLLWFVSRLLGWLLSCVARVGDKAYKYSVLS